MGKFILVSLMIMLMAGCATVASVNKDYAAVKYDDGINQKEAIAIAQKQLYSEKFYDQYMLSAPDVKNKDGFWSVAFLYSAMASYDYSMSFYRVQVDQKTGKILEASIYKKGVWSAHMHDSNI
jgi:hypothetical protein